MHLRDKYLEVLGMCMKHLFLHKRSLEKKDDSANSNDIYTPMQINFLQLKQTAWLVTVNGSSANKATDLDWAFNVYYKSADMFLLSFDWHMLITC